MIPEGGGVIRGDKDTWTKPSKIELVPWQRDPEITPLLPPPEDRARRELSRNPVHNTQ